MILQIVVFERFVYFLPDPWEDDPNLTTLPKNQQFASAYLAGKCHLPTIFCFRSKLCLSFREATSKWYQKQVRHLGIYMDLIPEVVPPSQ